MTDETEAAAEPVRRTSEIEDVTNLYFIHAIAGRLVPLFARLGVTPNAVSLTGMLCGVLAGFCYYHYRDLRWSIAGFLLMIAWHVMDGADGQLARLTHAQSKTGKMLDGICDYVTFITVYAALALALSHRAGAWIWPLVLVSGACHAVQSAAYEAQRQDYNFWARDQKSAERLKPTAASAAAVRRPADRLHLAYEKLQSATAGVDTVFDERLAAALRREPERADLRLRYRAIFAPAVRRWSVLSANYRTLGIFICAALKVPLLYFWFEIIGFTIILAVLLSKQRVRRADFLQWLDALPVGAAKQLGGQNQ